MTYERDEYMRRQEAEHDMIRMREPKSKTLYRQGCVCPPGAEATCKGPLCPRRPIGQPS